MDKLATFSVDLALQRRHNAFENEDGRNLVLLELLELSVEHTWVLTFFFAFCVSSET